jgi:hypothetical protein
MTRLIVITGLSLVILAACTWRSAPSVTPQDIQQLSEKQSILLLECQLRKVYDDRGRQQGDKYINGVVDQVMKSKQKDITVQYALAQVGYYCDAEERAAIAKEQRQAAQEAQWGPPAQMQDVNPGLFGGVFASEVDYKIDRETTGNWMGIAKAKELSVSTNANSEAELLNLAKTLKQAEAEGFDFTRIEYFGGKEDLSQQAYDTAGTICILNSEDGLLMFKDQYPLGGASKQAEQDYQQGDGIVFLASSE